MRARVFSSRVGRMCMIAAMAASVAAAGCGKKGPPRAPIVRLPGRAMDIVGKRLGSTIYVQFTVPSTNLDGTGPADLDHMEVYAYTALEASEGQNLKRITLLATIPVKEPPKPETDASAKDVSTSRPVRPGVEQGSVVALKEELTPALKVRLPPDPKAPKIKVVPELPPEFAMPLPLPFPEPEPARFYVAVGVNHKGDRGGMSPRPAVLLGEAPPAPDAPAATVTESAVVLSWTLPATLRRPYLDKGATVKSTFEALAFGLLVQLPYPPPLLSAVKGMPPEPAITYNVYRVPAPGTPPSEPVPQVPGLVVMPAPLGAAPTATMTFSDPIAAWGQAQCYGVRTVETTGTLAVESALSEVTCVTPADVFPPPAPTALAAVASQGAISLIWERVTAADLAGYLVLRGPAPDGPLEPLFEAPIRETTYRDATASPGVRYVYEIVAVDTATIPNRSAPSNRVTEAAR